ncbi:MAG: formylglycine-generating enzyme family protein [Thermoanaerobaculia bacterium]
MDVALLAEAVRLFLAPALPYLVGLGGKAAEEAAKEAGKAGVQKVWKRLRPEVEARAGAKEAAGDLAADPGDPDAQAAFRLQLKKLLAADEALAGEVARELEAAGVVYRAEQSGSGAIAQGSDQSVAGERGVAAHGGLHGSQVFTGDIEGGVHVGGAQPGGEPGTAALRTSYLSHLCTHLRKLALSGVDPALSSDPKARLDLDAVYTALRTRETRFQRIPSETPDDPPAYVGWEGETYSALEQLDRHDRLVLLGDPGSGKSTFVSFVALCLAGELLGRQDADLELLTSPLPPEDSRRRRDREEDPEPQPWSHGPLLPVRVVLRDFAARGLPAKGEQAGAGHLLEFLRGELDRAGLGGYGDELERELREEGGLLLLDGLDEVPEAEDRRVQLRAVVEGFAGVFPKCRILVTSRVYAYQDQDWRLDGFREATLAPFSEGQIRRFIERWYEEVARRRGLTTEDARGKAALLERAVFGSPRLRSLAERPLLLTLMASLHAWRGGTLPEKRERVYADTVDLLLSHWEGQRVVHGPGGEVIVQQPSLAEWLKVEPDRLRSTLEELAFRAHADQEDLEGTADLAEGDLLSALTRVSSEAEANPARLVEYLRDRAGMLLPRGVRVYTFPHRTFQEYLAACHLTGPSFPDELARLGRTEPERWREAVLLAGAKAARGAASTVWHLARELSFRDPDASDAGPEDYWGALLAGQVLAESADLESPSEANARQLDELRWRLLAVMRGTTLPAVERALAGWVLAELGDPREEVTTLDGMDFCWVPPGPFRMGSNENEAEQPVHDLDLPYGYWIGRYPVTVAQFRGYVEESGHEPGTRLSLQWTPNEPVAWVSWHDARHFCDWLTERWRRAGYLPEGWAVRLPSEAEWEKAARGGAEVPGEPRRNTVRDRDLAAPASLQDLQPNEHPERTVPWGDTFDEDKANTLEAGLPGPSAVGCFTAGAAPYGCEEMAGNVWEWTRSLWGKDFSEPAFRYPYVADDGREDPEATDEVLRVARGSGRFLRAVFGRCSARVGFSPNGGGWFLGFRLLLSPVSSDL